MRLRQGGCSRHGPSFLDWLDADPPCPPADIGCYSRARRPSLQGPGEPSQPQEVENLSDMGICHPAVTLPKSTWEKGCLCREELGKFWYLPFTFLHLPVFL